MRAHDISCSSFQFSGTVKMVGSDRKCGCSDTSDIVDTFSPYQAFYGLNHYNL